jgi:hypothetical protein
LGSKTISAEKREEIEGLVGDLEDKIAKENANKERLERHADRKSEDKANKDKIAELAENLAAAKVSNDRIFTQMTDRMTGFITSRSKRESTIDTKRDEVFNALNAYENEIDEKNKERLEAIWNKQETKLAELMNSHEEDRLMIE